MSSEEKDFCNKFAQLVEKHPCIYNPSATRRELIVDEAWNTISNDLGIPGHMCKDKWKSMKTAYKRCLSNNRHNQLYDSMAFMKPFLVSGSSAQTARDENITIDADPQIIIHSDEDEFDDYDLQFQQNFESSKKRKLNESATEQRAHSQNAENQTSTDELIQDILEDLSRQLRGLDRNQLKRFKGKMFMALGEVME